MNPGSRRSAHQLAPDSFRPLYRAVASLLLVVLATPSFESAVYAQQAVPQPPQPQATPATQPALQPRPAIPAGEANEATSTPIDAAPATPMEHVQAAVDDGTATEGDTKKPTAATPDDAAPLNADERALQVLNRFTYGPRPGDLEKLRAEGLSRWFSAQMNPATIDDSALERKLADYPAMQLPVARLMEMYPSNAVIRATMQGHGEGIPRGEGERAIYAAQEDRYKDKRKKGDDAAQAAASDPAPLPFDAATVLAMTPDDRFKALTRLSTAQFRQLRRETPDAQKAALTAGFSPHQMEVLAALANPQGLIASELVQTKLLRDVFSERQLNEVMVDFWLNHFNVYMKKSQQAPYYITAFERDTIRTHALGHFENLLVATAVSPAMLNYLDNASSVGPHSPSVTHIDSFYARRAPAQPKNASGLNENYARELMELHTLGVNGGYTQKDVTEVAKVFTGWTIGRPRAGGEPTIAEFDASKHEPGTKTVLGVKIKDNGSGEGMEVLHMLANSPQTARFISTKLAIRFVSDDPPPAMIARMSQRFLETHGDIRQVLLAMVNSPEFFTHGTYRAKVKTPQDYVISAVRASGAQVASAGALAASIADLGMPVYGMQTPQGYSMRTDAWNNTAALVSRMNFALALSTNRIVGVQTDWTALLNQRRAADGGATDLGAAATLAPDAKDKLLEDRILHMRVSDRTRKTILAQITADPGQQRASLNQVSTMNLRDPLSNVRLINERPGTMPDPQIALVAGLIFGSPEFQRR